MLSNAIDFRTRRKQRPKSADFEIVEDKETEAEGAGEREVAGPRSASVTDILESVSLGPAAPRLLEGRNSAPDLLPAAPLPATTCLGRCSVAAYHPSSTRLIRGY